MNKIEQKVRAINALNKYAAQVYEHEKKHFQQFEGLDIFKVNGEIKQKYQHDKMQPVEEKNEHGEHVSIHYYMEKNNYNLQFKVKICLNGGSYDVTPSTAFCLYEYKTLYIMNIESGVLKPCGYVQDFEQYDADKLTKAAHEAHEAAKVYKEKADAVPHIFREILNVDRLTR
jgi:hypothetical protein